jgi:hypothetical protein
MTSWFKGTAKVTAYLLVMLFVAAFLAGATPENSTLYNTGMGLMVATACVSPFIGVSLLVSGIGSIMETVNRNQSSEKRKRKNRLPLEDMDDDHRIRRIMAQLTPPDRDYLHERLADRQLGLSDDGEMVSLDDILADYDDSSQQTQSR